jgi:AmmeMemoRadiSam system protein B
MRRDKIRPAGVAGNFYSANKMVLERDLSLLLENSPIIENSHPVRGLIVPHAGYIYSGGVAARAYSQIISQNYDLAVIIAPSHHEYFEFLSVYSGYAFESPVGLVLVDQNSADEFASLHPDIQLSERGYSLSEHSLEVQLPLLKWVQDNIKILPIMMAKQGHESNQILTEALTGFLKDKNYLVIASSDLSHFHSDQVARSLDQVVVNHINNFEPDKLFEDIIGKRCEMCGYGAVIVTMKVNSNLNSNHAKVLIYRTSGDLTGDKTSVVGYLSAIIY